MCLERPSEKRIAEENIFCWKQLQRFNGKSLVQKHKYRPGVIQPKVEIKIDRCNTIEEGYHSWGEQEPKDQFGRSYKKVVKHLFVIPKGTVYYEGLENGGPVGYVSETIVYLGHVNNPLTWLRQLKYENK